MKRSHVSDALTLVGLVVLLAWTPAYLAQDPGQRAMAEGTTFEPAQLRFGDRVDLQILASDGNGTTRSTGTILRIAFLQPDVVHAALGAVLVEHRTWAPTAADLGSLRYVADGHEERRYYDINGTLIAFEREEAGRFRANVFEVDTSDEVERHRSTLQPGWLGNELLALRPAGPLRYEPSAPFVSLYEYVFQRTADGGSSVQVVSPLDDVRDRVAQAFRLGDQILYAHDVQDLPPDLIDSYAAPPTYHLGPDPFELPIHLDPGSSVVGGLRTWSYWSPEVPVLAGLHGTFLDPAGRPLASVDIVPSRVERGDEPVPFQRGQHSVRADAEHGRRVEPIGLPTVPLRTLVDDARPVFNGVSFADVAAALTSPDAPAEARSIMTDGGFIGAALWWSEASMSGSEWSVYVVHDDGRSTAVQVVFEEQTAVEWSDPCAEGPPEQAARLLRGTCAQVPVDPVIGDRKVVPPALLMEVLGAGSAGDRLGVFVPEPSVSMGYARVTWNGQHGLVHAQRDDDGVVVQHRDLATGAPLEMERTAVASPDTLAPPLRLAAAAPDLHVVHPLGTTAAFGGLLLVATGLLARLVVLGKTGGLLPAAAMLYGRVRKENALDHERRALLVDLVAADPGTSFAALCKQTDLPHTVAFHHLERLERHGLVRVLRLGRARHYFPPGLDLDGTTRRRLAAAHHAAWAHFLSAVEAEPGISLSGLVARLPVQAGAVSRMGKRLAGFQLVHKVQDGRSVRFYPAGAKGAEVAASGTASEAAGTTVAGP